ncbi:hypothetical protein MAPG_10676 [Magnaporthiopsis poae ATCC 64411]|uniref:RNase III domain-containing protein n=1 Tax=Magnaporthiopsis poae (strain ATCC 64411 / 73-15) TaxID=644358 RepID=A0A0C4ED83_MAGP6|nr:hypothetical protein MAPG_10676 [Magnaporthiopsis poae ATCC 64411]
MLIKLAEEVWESIPEELINNLIDFMPRRVEALYQARGGLVVVRVAHARICVIFAHNCTTGNANGNKPFALIGDALIRLNVAHRSYTDGVGTSILAAAVSNDALAALGSRLGLDQSVTKNPCHKGEVPRVTLASTVEALLGAVWVDSGNQFDQVQSVLRALQVTEPFDGFS